MLYMEKIAVFPGSFDPITRGHESIIRRAVDLFDKIIIAIGVNSEKSGFFPLEKRQKWIEQTFADLPKVIVETYSGLTVNYCEQKNARFIIRGLRTSADFEFERSIGQMNREMNAEIETVFLLTMPEHTHLNSSIVREIIKNNGDVSKFVPEAITI